MKTPTFRQRFQYWFDNYTSRGTVALILGLVLISALIIFALSGAATAAKSKRGEH